MEFHAENVTLCEKAQVQDRRGDQCLRFEGKTSYCNKIQVNLTGAGNKARNKATK